MNNIYLTKEEFINNKKERVIYNFLRNDLNAYTNYKKKPGNIIILNLERRNDRKEYMINLLLNNSFTRDEFQFFPAIDANHIRGTEILFKLFENNDFGYKASLIACCLSHLSIWNMLIDDPDHDYYIILEDDIKIVDDFRNKVNFIIDKMKSKPFDIILFGFTMFNNIRENNKDLYNFDCKFDEIEIRDLFFLNYIGGFFAYIISKAGVHKIFRYIIQNRIKTALDYVIKENNLIFSYEVRPQIVFAEWVSSHNNSIDSDIQRNLNCLDFSDININLNNYIYLHGFDHGGDDICKIKNYSLDKMIKICERDKLMLGFNTLGYIKKFINRNYLVQNNYIHCQLNSGIFIKKRFMYEFNSIVSKSRKIKIKLLGNWDHSLNICRQFSKFTQGNYLWNNMRIVWDNNLDEIDYFIIINSTKENFNINRSLLFKIDSLDMDNSFDLFVKKNRIQDFLYFIDINKMNVPFCYWKLDYQYIQIKYDLIDLKKDKVDDKICVFCLETPILYSEGRLVQFIKYLENLDNILINIDVYQDTDNNIHNFKNFRGSYVDREKDILIKYKYSIIFDSLESYCVSHKLWDSVFSGNYIFYWGNINKNQIDNFFFNMLTFININSFDESYSMIKDGIMSDIYKLKSYYIGYDSKIYLECNNIFSISEKILFKQMLLPYYPVNKNIQIDNNLNENKFVYEERLTDKSLLIHKYFFKNFIIQSEYNYIRNFVLIQSYFFDDVEMLNYILDYLSKYIDYFNKIFIINVGNKLVSNYIYDHIYEKIRDKIEIVNEENIYVFESLVYEYMKVFSKYFMDCNILFLNTMDNNILYFLEDKEFKGSDQKIEMIYNKKKKNIKYFKRLLDLNLYFLVDNIKSCIDILSNEEYFFKTVGCNYMVYPEPHYCSNFWWAKSNYINLLDLDGLRDNISCIFWIFSNKNYDLRHHYILYNFSESVYDVVNLNTVKFGNYKDYILKVNNYNSLNFIDIVNNYSDIIDKNLDISREVFVSFDYVTHIYDYSLLFYLWMVNRFSILNSICIFGNNRNSYLLFLNSRLENVWLYEDDIEMVKNRIDFYKEKGFSIGLLNVISYKYINYINEIEDRIDIYLFDFNGEDKNKYNYEILKLIFYNCIRKERIIVVKNILSDVDRLGRLFEDFSEPYFYKIKLSVGGGIGVITKNKEIVDIIVDEWMDNIKEDGEELYIHKKYFLNMR